MTDPIKSAVDYAHAKQQKFLGRLKEFASIPSISTDPTRKSDIQKAASWLVDQLNQLEAKNVNLYPTSGHPVVYADLLNAGIDRPTILIYGHYDVQPAEPLELWKSPAFTPTQHGDNLYARGVSDMKGQILVGLAAIESIKHKDQLPINLKFLLEGEEEIGSPSLDQFIADNKELLKCDFCLNLDSGILGSDIPSITYALRGLAYFELRVFGPEHDLHSGIYGGVVHNPAQALCELIARMHDNKGRVTLPGYYDEVLPLEEEERKELSRLPMGEDFYLKNTGAPALYGENGYTPVERVGARPTLEVNGLYSGFIGEGSKTVLPAYAMAKISMRLVPEQDPEKVYQQLLTYLKQTAPPTIRWELSKLAGGTASITDRNMPEVQALSQALETVWGVRPVFKREGGSVPVVAQMQNYLGTKTILSGFGLPDDNVHAPNEKLHIPTWYRGIDAIIHFFYNLAK